MQLQIKLLIFLYILREYIFFSGLVEWYYKLFAKPEHIDNSMINFPDVD